MPIIVKDFDWNESSSKLEILIAKKNVKSSIIDVMVTNLYVKVNYSPYFFDIHLREEIDDDKARIVFEGDMIAIHLEKKTAKIWGDISNPDTKDSTKRRELIAAAYKYHEDKEKRHVEERGNAKAAQNKMALRTAMDLDSTEKERIESVKQAERDKVSQEMDEWQSLGDDEKEKRYLRSIDRGDNIVNHNQDASEVQCSEPILTDNTPAITSESKPLTDAEERARKFEKIKHNLANPLKPNCDEGDNKKDQSKASNKSVWQESGPRKQQEINISFTPRYFPSAARESLATEEEAWIEKNIRAQTVVKPTDGDTKEDERNPLWLCDKANVFYKMGNFPSAVNAYSAAIKISPSLAKLYINRASCYIVLNLFEDAVLDCTRALELLSPPVEANRMSRVRTLAKRGSAYCQIELIDNAIADYELALKLSPDNDSLRQDLETLKAQSSSSPSGHPVTVVT